MPLSSGDFRDAFIVLKHFGDVEVAHYQLACNVSIVNNSITASVGEHGNHYTFDAVRSNYIFIMPA